MRCQNMFEFDPINIWFWKELCIQNLIGYHNICLNILIICHTATVIYNNAGKIYSSLHYSARTIGRLNVFL